jgi:hypothetical protein
VKGRAESAKSFWMAILLVEMIFAGTIALAGTEQTPRLAVLPFLSDAARAPGSGTLCPICRGPAREGDLPPGSAKILTGLLYQKMNALGTFHVLPMERVDEVFRSSDKKTFEEKPVAVAVHVGELLGAEFVFTGFLFRFEERIGSSWGAEKPASVGYHIHLIRTRDGRMVWSAKFDETQAPLSEDLLRLGAFLRRKASWLKAEELASVGLDEILKNLPSTQDLLK